MKPLNQKFFMRETTRVAEDLLGCFLVRKINRQTLIGQVVETEAYLGLKDPSCHSFRGRRTERTKTMYLPGAYSYVYFTYGMHYCFNVVTQTQKEPTAVLIRALQPLQGVSEMQKNRKKTKLTELCSGPGKLCQALHITKALNAKNLSQEGEIFISKDTLNFSDIETDHQLEEPLLESFTKKSVLDSQDIETDSRVGLPLYEDSSYWFLRFYIKNNPFVSLKKNQIS